ncbi:uncharacterized protein BcabD6B2_14310 [Babesia caballi]|uniref:Uncharacterized protein n=1 Tax=Babesia caballi TaxID=5871 RepID=A0AAV4LPI7_BABCB|nr:hypothetical protein, conserved [Babesia caballi]
MGEKKSLTDPPTNLKEAIDWLALVGGGFGGSGTGKRSELEKALDQLPGFAEVKTKVFGASKSPQGAILKLANGLGYGFLGYANQGGSFFSGEGIIDQSKGYKSAYAEAQWPSESDQQTCALIFLGSAYVTYYFVTFLYWHCKSGIKGDWIGYRLNQDSTGHRLGQFMKAMGFTVSHLQGKLGHEVAQILGDGYNAFDELDNISNIHLKYSIFHTALIKKASIQPLSCPLTACYRLAQEYFSLKSENTDVKNAMDSIKKQFEKLRGYGADDYSTLKQNIQTFLSKVTTFTPSTIPTATPQQPSPGGSTTSSSQTSPAGPIAGALTTLGLSGGAAAAYILNIAGAKTLVKGLLRIG